MGDVAWLADDEEGQALVSESGDKRRKSASPQLSARIQVASSPDRGQYLITGIPRLALQW